jgi:photosystem II stability/assembly factor-like uncharacterized protein
MKKHLIFLTLFIGCLIIMLQSSVAQLTLEELNAPKEGLHINAIAMTTENIGVTVGDFGTILSTSDGFTTWKVVPTGTKKEFFAVAFFDATVGIAVGADGILFRTLDAGASWQLQPSGVQDALRSIAIIGNSAIVVGSNGVIIETKDKGVSWVKRASGYSVNLNSIRFRGIQNGIIVGEGGLILRSNNSGQTWNRMNSDSSEFLTLNSVDWSDDTTITAVGFYGLVMRSTDAGLSWQRNSALPSLANYKLNRVYFVNQTIGFIGGVILTNSAPQTSVLWTNDGGITWKDQDSIYSLVERENTALPAFFDFIAVSPTKYFAVGSDYYNQDKTTIISSTNDGGLTWKFNLYQKNGWLSTYANNRKYLISKGYNDITFIDNQNGIVAGYGGIMLKTSDGGDTWQSIQTGTKRTIQRIAMYDRNTIVALGDTCMVLFSNDGGQSWVEQYPLADSSASLPLLKVGFPAFSFSDSRTVWVSGYNYRATLSETGMVFRTTDGGKTFSRVMIPRADNDFYYSIVFKSPLQGWMSGYRNMSTIQTPLLLHTSDGGQTWEELSLPPLKKGEGISIPMVFTDTLHGSIPLLGANDGTDAQTYFHTIDGGKTWTRQEPYNFASPALSMDRGTLRDISFADEQHGIILASRPNSGYNKIHYTNNAGISWKHADFLIDSKYFNREFYKISYPTPERCWVLGIPYRIFRLTFNETSAVITDWEESNKTVLYSANGSIVIPIDKKMNLNRLSIFITDIMGRRIDGREISKFNIDDSVVEIDGSSFPTGIYYVEIIGSDFRKSVPIIIAR